MIHLNVPAIGASSVAVIVFAAGHYILLANRRAAISVTVTTWR